MAATFSDLHTDADLQALNEYLSGRTFISGDEISRDDVKVYAAVLKKPGDGFANMGRWYDSVALVLAARFPGEAVGVRVSARAAAPAPSEEVAKDASNEDDNDLDLFGDETEEEKKAVEEREASKASSKKKESGKFSILMDLAPVGYGIMLTIVDDLVSVDSIIEEHLTVEPCNKYVQSCDIVAFNKI
ncbi:hypothetical protein Taro_020256 [Colocasia esculenta]|uniref:Translation elongation factor EF1B beta/delta subunit guanine nucleotide exchange domain-containing protein n=1 Tax=Colocasia esculenta TaxID=4460 RepID=A0A843UVT7_COLES|nr:hypothetical protein [Colocasia esculenta]